MNLQFDWTKVLSLIIVPLIMAVGFIFDFQSMIMLFIIPAIFLIVLLFPVYKILIPVEFYIWGLLVISSFISYVNIVDLSTYFRDVRFLIGQVIVTYIFIFLAYKKKNIYYIFLGFIISLFIYIIDASLNNELFSMANTDYERLMGKTGNANTFGYYIFISNFAIFYIKEMKIHSKIFDPVILLIFGLEIWILIGTASRAGLMIQIATIVLYYIYFKGVTGLLKKGLSLGAIIYFSFKIYDFIINQTFLGVRIEQTDSFGSNDIRFQLMEKSIELFIEFPFFGIGPGQFIYYNETGLFTHNSYSELIVTQGAIGFGIYMLLLYFFFKRIIRIRPFNKNIYKLSLMYFVLFSFYSFFYPFYKFLPVMSFTFLVIIFLNYIEKTYDFK